MIAVAIPALAQAPTTNGDNIPNVQKLLVDATPYQKPVSSTEAYFEATEPIAKAPKSNAEAFESIKAYITTLWGDKADLAIKVFVCESGLHQDVINWNDAKITGMPSQGIAQINRPLDPKLLDWKYNLTVAYYDYYLKRGFSPWSCATKLGIK